MMKAIPMQDGINCRDYTTCNYFFGIVSNKLSIVIIIY